MTRNILIRPEELASPLITSASAEAVRTWLVLFAMSARECNGGVISGAKQFTADDWAKWRVTGDGVIAAIDSGLLIWRGDCLVLAVYDHVGEQKYVGWKTDWDARQERSWSAKRDRQAQRAAERAEARRLSEERAAIEAERDQKIRERMSHSTKVYRVASEEFASTEAVRRRFDSILESTGLNNPISNPADAQFVKALIAKHATYTTPPKLRFDESCTVRVVAGTPSFPVTIEAQRVNGKVRKFKHHEIHNMIGRTFSGWLDATDGQVWDERSFPLVYPDGLHWV